MNLNEIMQRIDYGKPFAYKKEFTLASHSASDSETLIIGNQDFACFDYVITGYDSAGVVMHKAISGMDKITLDIKDQNGNHFQNDPCDVFTLNKEFHHYSPYPRWYVQRQTELTLVVAGDGFPASEILTFPIKIEVMLSGYKLFSQG